MFSLIILQKSLNTLTMTHSNLPMKLEEFKVSIELAIDRKKVSEKLDQTISQVAEEWAAKMRLQENA
jgi:hypothetical protein